VKHFIHESKKAHTAKPVYQYALKCGKLNALFLCSLTGARIFSAAVGNNRVFSGGKI
jgi:ubiquitin